MPKIQFINASSIRNLPDKVLAMPAVPESRELWLKKPTDTEFVLHGVDLTFAQARDMAGVVKVICPATKIKIVTPYSAKEGN